MIPIVMRKDPIRLQDRNEKMHSKNYVAVLLLEVNLINRVTKLVFRE